MLQGSLPRHPAAQILRPWLVTSIAGNGMQARHFALLPFLAPRVHHRTRYIVLSLHCGDFDRCPPCGEAALRSVQTHLSVPTLDACRCRANVHAATQQLAGHDFAAELEVSSQSPGASATTATLGRLGWPALCEFVARFASTTLGRQQCQQLHLPEEHETTEHLVLETAAVDKLESEYAIELDFGGASTQQVSAHNAYLDHKDHSVKHQCSSVLFHVDSFLHSTAILHFAAYCIFVPSSSRDCLGCPILKGKVPLPDLMEQQSGSSDCWIRLCYMQFTGRF